MKRTMILVAALLALGASGVRAQEAASAASSSAVIAPEPEPEPERQPESESEPQLESEPERQPEPEPEPESDPQPEPAGSADGCEPTARPMGPSQASFLDGQLGVPRRACMRTELALSGDGYLVARPADFYGNIRIGARLSGSYVIDDRVEIWASLEILRYQNIISAVSTAYLGLGYSAVGATLPLLREEQRAIAGYARLVLPTTTGLDRGSQPLALELGGTAELAAHPNLRVHAWLSLLGSIAISQIAPVDPRGGLRVGGGLDWVPYEALSFVLELASGFGYRDGLDFLAIQAAIRLALGDVVGVELAASVPLAGAEIALATATLSLSARFGGH